MAEEERQDEQREPTPEERAREDAAFAELAEAFPEASAARRPLTLPGGFAAVSAPPTLTGLGVAAPAPLDINEIAAQFGASAPGGDSGAVVRELQELRRFLEQAYREWDRKLDDIHEALQQIAETR